MGKIKELHVWLDIDSWDGYYPDGSVLDICETMADTVRAINSTANGIVHTTQIEFLKFGVAEKVYIHVYGKVIELVDSAAESLSYFHIALGWGLSSDNYSEMMYLKLKQYEAKK